MFSYQNKVVGIKITGQAYSDLFDLLVNNAYVGSTTDETQGDGAYLIASNDNVYTFAGNEDYNAYYFYGEDKPIYYFSDLLLNEGPNQLSFINKKNNASSNLLRYEVNSYELSGSYLTSPSSIQTGEISPTAGSDASVFFNLAFPTTGSISLVETFPVFNIDTGNLNQVFTGSGVHLQKDVTLFFDILDQQLNTVSSNQQFLENPLISGCVFDVLNADGTTAAANFSTGKFARSVTISALDNEDIFGSYQKDFGVRCKLPNTFDGSIFTGEFYVFGNLPNILDIVPDYTEFSGAAQVTELINAAIVLQNDLNFTQMNRYDVYALTGSGSAVNELTYLSPFAQEGYLFSQSAANVVNARSLTINRGALPQDVPHYFTVVPYGTLGSGSAFSFGPATFVSVQSVIELDTKVYTTGDQTISGVKTFATGIFAPNLVFNTGDQVISGVKDFALRPTVNGTGVLLFGEAGSGASLTDVVFTTGNQTINGLKTFATGIFAPNLVFNTGDQTISGVKTFATGIFAPNLVFNTGAQTISGLKTFSNGIVSSVGITGTNLVFNTGDQTISGVKTFATGIFAPNLVFNTGAQTISGVKTFTERLTVNGTQVVLSGEAATPQNLAATGSNLQTSINNLSGYSNSTFATITNLAATGSANLARINSLSGYSNSTFGTITNLAATGSNLQTSINNLSGYSNSTFATITNLAATGSTLNTRINNLSGYINSTDSNIVFTTGNQTISGLKTFATGIFAPNLVFNTGDQTISGLKTFSNGIISSVGITGTNLVFNTGAQTISGVKTFANNIFAPTASFGTNTTQIATTAFVDNAVTSDQIMSTIGSNLITSLKVARSNEQNAGIYYFATYNNLSSTFTVKTSPGYARVVNPTGGLDSQVGGGVAANNITGTLSSTSTNGLPRAFAVISVASGGSTRSGNITEISMPDRFITNFNGGGLSSLTTLSLYNNSLTSFSCSGLSAVTSLTLSDNSLTSFSGSGLGYTTYVDLSRNFLTSFSATGVSAISILKLNNNSLTGVNMNNLTVGGYSSGPYTYYVGLDVSSNNLSADALEAMYTSLGSFGGGVIDVRDNPGAASSDPSTATAKGYTVIGALPPP